MAKIGSVSIFQTCPRFLQWLEIIPCIWNSNLYCLGCWQQIKMMSAMNVWWFSNILSKSWTDKRQWNPWLSEIFLTYEPRRDALTAVVQVYLLHGWSTALILVTILWTDQLYTFMFESAWYCQCRNDFLKIWDMNTCNCN